MYPQGVCRIRKPAYAGNGCAIFPIFQTADWEQKIRCPAADDLFRVSLMYSVLQGRGLPPRFRGQAPALRWISREERDGQCPPLSVVVCN